MKLFTLIAFLTILFLSCQRDPILFEIDNPSDVNILVSFAGQEPFILKKHSTYSDELSPGLKKVKFDNGEEVSFTLSYRYKTLLNPTRSKYYVESIQYMSDKAAEINMGSMRRQDTIIIGGYKITGNYQELDTSVVINGDWTFGLKDYAPTSIEIKTDQYSLGYVSANKGKLISEYQLIEQIEREKKVYIIKLKDTKVDDKTIKILLSLTDEQYRKLSGSK